MSADGAIRAGVAGCNRNYYIVAMLVGKKKN